jgi:hypothetical protein
MIFRVTATLAHSQLENKHKLVNSEAFVPGVRFHRIMYVTERKYYSLGEDRSVYVRQKLFCGCDSEKVICGVTDVLDCFEICGF